jgi:hypothetical protein
MNSIPPLLEHLYMASTCPLSNLKKVSKSLASPPQGPVRLHKQANVEFMATHIIRMQKRDHLKGCRRDIYLQNCVLSFDTAVDK